MENEMLYLMRQVGQEITIGDDITIIVHKIEGKQVTFGLKAPRKLRILRPDWVDPFYIERDNSENEKN